MTGFIVGLRMGTFFGWSVCALVAVNTLTRGEKR